MSDAFCTRVVSVATGSDKTLLTLFNPIATPTVRARLRYLQIGGIGTPGDNAADFLLNRITAVGTEGSGLVPHNVNGGPAGDYDSGLGVFSVEPTYTAAAQLWGCQLNHRGTIQKHFNEGYEPILAATQNNGAGLKSVTSGSTQAYGVTLEYIE